MASIDKDRIVNALREEWAVLAELGDSLSEDELAMPTACPGWTVRDNISHMIGTEEMLAGHEAPAVEVGAAPHLKNPIGEANEVWVISMRDLPVTELMARFRAITSERLAALDAMSQADFDAESWTPAGQSVYGRFMQIRVFDCWMHEQDIREAIGRAGHTDTAPAAISLEEVGTAIGYIVGKLGGAPDGSRVEINLTGPVERTLRVAVEGRAKQVDVFDGAPTSTLTMPFDLFLRLAGGRQTADAAIAEGMITLGGDEEVAGQIARNLAFTI